jgi:hypothetical protein
VFTNRNNSFFVGRRKAASFAPLAAAPESNKKITWGFALVGCVPIALIYLVDFLGGYFPTLKEVFFILYVPFISSLIILVAFGIAAISIAILVIWYVIPELRK